MIGPWLLAPHYSPSPPLPRNILIPPKLHAFPLLQPFNHPLHHPNHMRHTAAIRMQYQGENDVRSLVLFFPRTILPQPLKAIFPHLLNETHVDVAVGVWDMWEVGEWSHVFHIPIASDFDEGGGSSGGGREGGWVHPGSSGFREVGRLDVSVKGSEIWLGVMGAEGGICFGFNLDANPEVGDFSRRTVREAMIYQELYC